MSVWPARADLDSGKRALEMGDYGAAYRSLEPLARAGETEAQYWIGYLLHGAYCGAEDPDTAIGWFRKAADGGHATAQRMVGAYYAAGRGGLMQDFAAAAEWYARAVEQGDAIAQRDLGHLYQDGRGVDVNLELAADLYARAAAQGDIEARRDLAYMYYFGMGVPFDYAAAAELFLTAVQAGSSEADFDLGRLYYRGHGVPLDLEKAAEHFRGAAEAGHARAQIFLGRMYYRGEGVERDALSSFVWFQIASGQEPDAAARYLAPLRARLSANQIAKGEEQAAAFEPLPTIGDLGDIAPAAGPSTETPAASACFP